MSDLRALKLKFKRMSCLALLTLVLQACGQESVYQLDGYEIQDANRDEQERTRAWGLEMQALEAETPLHFNLDELYRRNGYSSFPARIFVPKHASIPQGHDFLMITGHQVYQRALLAAKKENFEYATHAVKILNKIVEVDLNFKGDPNNPSDTNDNRYLEAAWFISSLMRGALIIDKEAPAHWRQQQGWDGLKQRLIAWVDRSGKSQGDGGVRSMVDLISDRGVMNWVTDSDRNGSTNRTFALFEAQFRVAEFRGGVFRNGVSMRDVWNDFRNYLPRYFTGEYTCRGRPELQGSNQQTCLRNKDEPRNDTYHPLMGLASVVHIIEIAKRYGLELSDSEQAMVIKGLRGGADHNTARPGGFSEKKLSRGIDVWEIPFRLFSAGELGPMVQRDRDINRSQVHYKKAGLAWGYSLISDGY